MNAKLVHFHPRCIWHNQSLQREAQSIHPLIPWIPKLELFSAKYEAFIHEVSDTVALSIEGFNEKREAYTHAITSKEHLSGKYGLGDVSPGTSLKATATAAAICNIPFKAIFDKMESIAMKVHAPLRLHQEALISNRSLRKSSIRSLLSSRKCSTIWNPLQLNCLHRHLLRQTIARDAFATISVECKQPCEKLEIFTDELFAPPPPPQVVTYP